MSRDGWTCKIQVVCALNTSGKVKILFDDRAKSDKNFVCSVGQKIQEAGRSLEMKILHGGRSKSFSSRGKVKILFDKI